MKRRPGKVAATAWLSGYLRKNPNATVDQAARDAEKAGHAVRKRQVAEMRRAMRAPPVIPNARPEGKILLEPEPSQPEAPKEPPMPQQPLPPQQPKPPEPQDEIEIPEDEVPEDPSAAMKAFLNSLVDKDPGIKPTVAQARIIERFGSHLNSHYLYATLRIAREMHRLPPILKRTSRADARKAAQTADARLHVVGHPPSPQPEPQASSSPQLLPTELLRELWSTMAAGGIVSLEVRLDGGEVKWTARRTTVHEGSWGKAF